MFTHLKVKSNYSLLKGLSGLEELITRAKELNFTSLALTDENVVYAYPEFKKLCKKHNIKPIYGIDLSYYVEGLKYSLILLAKNASGFKAINKLSSYVMTSHQIDYDILKKYSRDLICITPGYESGYIEDKILKDDHQEAIEALEKLRGIFKDFYISYSYHGLEIEKQLSKNILEFCNENDIKMVCVNNVMYARKEDANYHNYLEAIKNNEIVDNQNICEHYYMKSNEEMMRIAKGQMVENINYITNNCNVIFDEEQNHIPVYKSYSNYDSEAYLRAMTEKGLKKRYQDELTKDHIERLNYELRVITEMNFSDYFLIVFDFIRYAKKQGIKVGPGRGSACSSIVSYCLGITNVDPIKYNLIFERFLNPERISMPDIDIDFQDDRRDEVIKYVRDKYGHDKVSQIIAFSTYGAKMAIRDVAKAMNIPSGEIDKIASAINKGSDVSLENSYKDVARFRDLINSSQKYTELLKVAKRIEGNPKHTTIHAAGIVLSNKKISDIIGVQSTSDDFLTTQISMNYLEDFGLLKIDFLGLRNLSLLNNIVEAINHDNQDNFDIDDIDLEDPKTLELFQRGDTNGIFQFESDGMKQVLRGLKPTTFKDVYACNALFRPGPMENIDEFTKRRHGLVNFDYLDDSLVSILDDTYGIIVYQEQILEIARKMASYSYGEADILRKAMGKKNEDLLLNQKDLFIKRCLKNGHSKEIALEVYELIFKFSNYGFNKSHSVAYSIVGFQLAYLKVHYTKYFMASMLYQSRHSSYSFLLYKKEAKKYGVEVLKPCLLKSGRTFAIEGPNIRCSLNTIKAIKPAVVESIIETRKTNSEFVDFVCGLSTQGVNKETVIKLIMAGTFDCFNFTKKSMILNLDEIYQYAELINFTNEGQVSFQFQTIKKPRIKRFDEYPDNVLLDFEIENYGYYLEAHPVDMYKQNIECNHALEVGNYLHKKVSLVLYINKVKEIKTKNSKLMAFLTGSDEMGDVNLTLFPDIYATIKGNLQNKVVHVFGQVDERNNSISVLVNSMKIL